MVRTGAPWRSLPTTFPPWPAVRQQDQRWSTAGYVADLIHDLRALRRAAAGLNPVPTAVILDGKTLRGTP